jgi:molybdate transport system substrate-binding protein
VKRRELVQAIILGLVVLGGIVSNPARADSDSLLIYCGITMVRPVTELARNFERREKVRIAISQGGSEDLYQSAKRSRQGDIYLPGEPSYRARYVEEGLLSEATVVGYNQMALVVQKGNPRGVKASPQELLRKDLTVMLGNAESGSVGKASKSMLDSVGIYPKVVAKATLLMPDSRALNLAMKRGEADVTVNWRATAFFPENAPHIDVVDLDPKLAQPQALLMMPLIFSHNPPLARRFIEYVASEEGQAVFRKFGFLDNRVKY